MTVAHLALIHEQPCAVCNAWPVAVHHVIGGSIVERIGVRGSRKHSDFICLALCHQHHQGTDGIHTIGVRSWEARFGRQDLMIDDLGQRLGMDLWAKASAEIAERRAGRKYRKPSKINPRRDIAA